MYKKFFISLTLLITSTQTFATQPGVLDTTFNSSGVQPGTQSTLVDNKSATGNAVALQNDGKIVIVGITVDFLPSIARFNTDGSLDTTFNAGGAQPGTNTTLFGGLVGPAQGVAIQRDGKIVVVGVNFGASKFALARFNSDGTLDTTFGTGGTVLTNVDGGTAANAHSIAIQSDDKIVVAGNTTIGVNRFGIARFNTDGSLDTSFNPAGPGLQPGTNSTLVDGGTSAAGNGVAIQSDGKAVVAGFTTIGVVSRFGIARFNTDGTLDTTFNAGDVEPGTNAASVNGSTTAFSFGVAIQANGNIVLSGQATIPLGGGIQFGVAQFNTDGTLDTTFNAGGTQPGTNSTIINAAGTDNNGAQVAIQNNGKIVMTGDTGSGATGQLAVARFNPDGSLDATFNPTGSRPGTVSTTIENGTTNIGRSVAIQNNGKIVAAGQANIPEAGGAASFAVARFFGDTITPPISTTNACALRFIEKYGARLSA